MSQFVAVVKLGYVPLVNDDEEVVPGNIGALRLGLEALKKEDSSDHITAQQLWELAKQELRNESNDDSEVGSVMVTDEFDMGRVGEPLAAAYLDYGG